MKDEAILNDPHDIIACTLYHYYQTSTTPNVQTALTLPHSLCVMISSISHNIEPQHEISNNVVCATSKASDQPVHMRSLIRAFASRLIILWMLSYWLNIIWSF